MRMMLRIAMAVEPSNKALRDGTLPKLIQQTTELLKPEAAYFTADGGQRTAYFFFDMNDSSLMPVISEPWFTSTNAKVEYLPVMNGDDLRQGLEKIRK
jgi:hypothetical protein